MNCARDILARELDIPISIDADVSPQMREFERFNTVCQRLCSLGAFTLRFATGRMAAHERASCTYGA